MNTLNFSENIIRLRREKKLTQEELANFIGVTKAAVSKWENKQSLPDILLLLQLASFFNVTVDELLGYEAQLSREQIQKLYMDLTADFASGAFNQAMEKLEKLIRRYYSCYPFLLQVSILLLNHFMLTPDKEQQTKILNRAVQLCDRIIQNEIDVGICSDAIALKATLLLYLGKSDEVIEILKPTADPLRLSYQNDLILLQAYQTAGQIEIAESYAQITQYLHLLSLIGASIQSLANCIINPNQTAANFDICMETIKRTDGLIALYHLNTLHPNLAAQFYYQCALVFAVNGNQKNALSRLTMFAEEICLLFHENNYYLHGDSYFNRLDVWIEKLSLGSAPPRDKRLAIQSVLDALAHPAFSAMHDTSEFQLLYKKLLFYDQNIT